jgi:AraC-like DNA-binding protein
VSSAGGSSRFVTSQPHGLPGVDGVWCHRQLPDESALTLGLPERHFVPPDGCSDLILHFNQGRLVSAFVQEPTLAFDVVTIEPVDSLFGVRFTIGRAGPLLAAAASVAAEAERVFARVDSADAPSLLEQLGRYGAELLARRAGAPPAWLSEAWSEAQRRFGDITVRALARHVGVSERTLHRGFLDWVGAAPKPFLRALRVREAASRTTQGPRALAEIAAELGFADQAHLSREMRELWGATPARLRRQPSDFFKTPPAPAP